jgi:trigger factor
MNVLIKNSGDCRRTLKIEVPAEAVAEERAGLLNVYAKGVALPGFRKGHAPEALVEKKFAKEMAEDLKDRVVPRFYHEAIEKENLKVVGVIDVSEPELADGQPLRFEVTVDVEPEFKLPKYEGISIKAESTDVEEKQVDETVDHLRRQNATHEDVEGRPAREKDMVQISYESTIGGQPLEEKVPEARGMGRGTGYWITCDDESFLPGMGRKLIGATIGDKKEIAVAFPDDFIVKELAGMKADFKVEVTGLRETRLPEFDEEFLKQLRVESEEELRKNIREHLEEAAVNKEKSRQQDKVCEYLLKKTKLDVAETDLKEQSRMIMYDIARRRMMQGMSQEQVKAQSEDMMEEAKEKAVDQVKLRYILLAIADAEEIQANDQDVSDEIARMAIQQRRDAADYRKKLEKEGQIDAVRDQIRVGRTLDRLIEKAKIK